MAQQTSDSERPARIPHRFHSMEYVAKWAHDVGNPVRESVFHHILAQLVLLDDESPHIVELASGPGILAEFLLERLPNATYEGMDYSEPMLTLARERTERFGERVHLHQVDLRDDDWPRAARRRPQALISMQALHDVGDEPEHEAIYAAAKQLIHSPGLFLNADLVRQSGKGPTRIPLSRHLAMLSAAGFDDVESSLKIGAYACIKGIADDVR
ncbi:MAG: class I SAM-dependent methyltransferase [Gammaproteobacteria bacterium]|nr:class I SAM-dependent methyltransferase [Gammaproteobacteria bacterium]